jgi:hypothetical protein
MPVNTYNIPTSPSRTTAILYPHAYEGPAVNPETGKKRVRDSVASDIDPAYGHEAVFGPEVKKVKMATDGESIHTPSEFFQNAANNILLVARNGNDPFDPSKVMGALAKDFFNHSHPSNPGGASSSGSTPHLKEFLSKDTSLSHQNKNAILDILKGCEETFKPTRDLNHLMRDGLGRLAQTNVCMLDAATDFGGSDFKQYKALINQLPKPFVEKVLDDWLNKGPEFNFYPVGMRQTLAVEKPKDEIKAMFLSDDGDKKGLTPGMMMGFLRQVGGEHDRLLQEGDFHLGTGGSGLTNTAKAIATAKEYGRREVGEARGNYMPLDRSWDPGRPVGGQHNKGVVHNARSSLQLANEITSTLKNVPKDITQSLQKASTVVKDIEALGKMDQELDTRLKLAQNLGHSDNAQVNKTRADQANTLRNEQKEVKENLVKKMNELGDALGPVAEFAAKNNAGKKQPIKQLEGEVKHLTEYVHGNFANTNQSHTVGLGKRQVSFESLVQAELPPLTELNSRPTQWKKPNPNSSALNAAVAKGATPGTNISATCNIHMAQFEQSGCHKMMEMAKAFPPLTGTPSERKEQARKNIQSMNLEQLKPEQMRQHLNMVCKTLALDGGHSYWETMKGARLVLQGQEKMLDNFDAGKRDKNGKAGRYEAIPGMSDYAHEYLREFIKVGKEVLPKELVDDHREYDKFFKPLQDQGAVDPDLLSKAFTAAVDQLMQGELHSPVVNK